MRHTISAVASVPLLTLALIASPQDRDAQSDGQAPLLTPAHTMSGHSRLVRCLAFAPNGVLASGGQDRLLCLWSQEGRRIRRIDLQPVGV